MPWYTIVALFFLSLQVAGGIFGRIMEDDYDLCILGYRIGYGLFPFTILFAFWPQFVNIVQYIGSIIGK